MKKICNMCHNSFDPKDSYNEVVCQECFDYVLETVNFVKDLEEEGENNDRYKK